MVKKIHSLIFKSVGVYISKAPCRFCIIRAAPSIISFRFPCVMNLFFPTSIHIQCLSSFFIGEIGIFVLFSQRNTVAFVVGKQCGTHVTDMKLSFHCNNYSTMLSFVSITVDKYDSINRIILKRKFAFQYN